MDSDGFRMRLGWAVVDYVGKKMDWGQYGGAVIVLNILSFRL